MYRDLVIMIFANWSCNNIRTSRNSYDRRTRSL